MDCHKYQEMVNNLGQLLFVVQNSPKLPCTGQFTEPFVNFVSDW